MEQNVGDLDRTVRLVVGALFVIVGVAGFTALVPVAVGPVSQFLASTVLVLAGVVVFVTGLRRRCLLYRPFGIDTRSRRA